jgi:hypothetical protein
MQTAANAKYAGALAHDIADALNAAPQATGVQVYYDRAGETYGVRVRVGRDRYELLMPAPGAMYALFRNRAWLGGVNLSTDAAPVDVAIALLDRIAHATH